MMLWLGSTEMGLARLIVEGEFFVDLDHEVHPKYLGQDLEQKMMKMKEVDKLLLMNIFFFGDWNTWMLTFRMKRYLMLDSLLLWIIQVI